MNKCTITMIIIIINVKNFLDALMLYKARQVFCDLFSTNQENGLEMTFVTGVTKINL